ncbi:hypothetical protein AB5N19_02081 [Seiridium cardinale]|uniref:Uncharacterized protein n=1 Tax=Seiridium cardinale TaxID=138064 RepID=A0ABR2XN15_9PEZI
MKSSIVLLVASSVLAVAVPTLKQNQARSILQYAVKDYENEDEAKIKGRSILQYAVKDYENEAEE